MDFRQDGLVSGHAAQGGDIYRRRGLGPRQLHPDRLYGACHGYRAICDGGTMVLEGSHRLEGTGVAYLRQCPTAQIEAPRGNVIYFPETLMHAAVPILSEKRRYVMFYAFVAPWFEV